MFVVLVPAFDVARYETRSHVPWPPSFGLSRTPSCNLHIKDIC